MLCFIILLCLMADNFTRQGESAGTQCIKFTSDGTNSELRGEKENYFQLFP
jgi:hypothetical protein